MFGRRRTEPEPPKRTVWADKTKATLDDIHKRRAESIRKLDEEEQTAKALCNHTYIHGESALTTYYDDDNCPYTICSSCNR